MALKYDICCLNSLHRKRKRTQYCKNSIYINEYKIKTLALKALVEAIIWKCGTSVCLPLTRNFFSKIQKVFNSDDKKKYFLL